MSDTASRLPVTTPPPYQAYLDRVTGSGIKSLETAGNNPGEFIPKAEAAGLIDELPSCEERIQRMVAECHQRLAAAQPAFA